MTDEIEPLPAFVDDPDEWLWWRRLAALQGVTTKTLDARVKRGLFPRPRQLVPNGGKGMTRRTYQQWLQRREAKVYRAPAPRGTLKGRDTE